MSEPMTLFQVAGHGMSAQMVRMNTAASNLANAGAVAGSEAEAYRPLRPVFEAEMERASGLASVRVSNVIQSDVDPVKRRDPDHPFVDENGDVWEASVDQQGEMVEIMESARQYQNLVEALQTAKQLMLETMRSN